MLLPFALNARAELLPLLQDLSQQLERGIDLASLNASTWDRFEATNDAEFMLAIVARDVAELQREVRTANATASAAWEQDREWKTPNGSFLTPNPQGRAGRLTFVYPGIGSLYPGCLSGLDQAFPTLLDSLPRVPRDQIEPLLHHDLLWPQADAVDSAAATLSADITTQAELCVSLCYVLTHLLRDEFGLQPTAAIGNSLGELSMFASCGVWQRPQELAARMRASNIFPQRISGPLTAVRDAWGTEANWASYLVKGSAALLQQRLQQEQRVCLTHINTPDEVVIAGDPPHVLAILDELGATWQRLPFQLAYHTHLCEPSATELDELYRLELDVRPEISFTSMAPFSRIPHDSRLIARTLVNTALKPVDFPQIVETAWQQGSRVFVEIGPRQNCATWIRGILGDRPHAAVSIDQKGADAVNSLTRMIAALMSHGVPLNRAAVQMHLNR